MVAAELTKGMSVIQKWIVMLAAWTTEKERKELEVFFREWKKHPTRQNWDVPYGPAVWNIEGTEMGRKFQEHLKKQKL